MELKIHTKGIKGSSHIEEGEHADVMISAILEIDGHLVERVQGIRVVHHNSEIAYVAVRLIPGSIDTISHTQESWHDVIARLDTQQTARSEH